MGSFRRTRLSRLQKLKDNPNSRYWRTKADGVWAALVKRSGHCFICNCTGRLEAHHLISRYVPVFRHDLMNGLPLCSRHHKFDRHTSAHMGPIGFAVRLQREAPMVWAWLEKQLASELPKEPVETFKDAYDRLMATLASYTAAERQLAEPTAH